MLLATCDILLNRPIYGTVEVVEFMLVVLVFGNIGYNEAKKANGAADIVLTRLPEGIRTILGYVTSLVSIGIVAVITWQFGIRAWSLIINPRITTSTLGVSIGPLLAIAALGFLVLWLELVVDFGTRLVQAIGGKSRH